MNVTAENHGKLAETFNITIYANSTEAGKQIIESAVQQMRTSGFDYLHWAKFPKSAQAILLLKRGIKDDKRLADIWNHHLATDGADCQPAARAQLLSMKENYKVVEID